MRHWRRELGVDQPIVPNTGGDAGDWAEWELGRAALGDRRLTRRLVTCARLQARQPGASFRTAAQHDRAAVAGYYRLMERPSEPLAGLAARILEPQRQRTLECMRSSQAVLCLQDGTTLNFATRPATTGLGRLEGGRGDGARGLHLHAMLAVDQRGVPLGVPRLEFDAPARPAATSKSGRWLRGLEACAELAAEIGNVPLISVMDREGDCFELFRQPRSRVELLVRAQHNRRLGDQLPKLFDRMRAAPAQVRVELSLDRVSACGGAHRGREARIARLAVKWRQVEVPSPRRNRTGGHPVGGTCHREPTAAGSRTRGMATADQPARDRPPAGPAGAGVVSPALAHRRLVPAAQDRVPGRSPATATSRKPAARRDPARGDRLAIGRTHPPGTRRPGTTRRDHAHRHRTHRAAGPGLR